MVHLRT